MRRDELLSHLQASAETLDAHGRSPDSDHGKSYAPGKWSVRQMMAHVADVELINGWRFLRAVAEPGSAVEVFDENVWARELDYAARPVALSREVFIAARRLLLHHLRTLPDARLDGACRHPEKGLMTGWEWCQLIHDHGMHHEGQIAAARAGRPWVSPPRSEDSWKYLGK